MKGYIMKVIREQKRQRISGGKIELFTAGMVTAGGILSGAATDALTRLKTLDFKVTPVPKRSRRIKEITT
jgi:hypothetical protein